MARNDGRTPAKNVFGKPGVSYPEDDLTKPMVVEKRTASQMQAKKVQLSQHPDAARYPGCLLTKQGSDPGDNTDANFREQFETLPGPPILTTIATSLTGVFKVTAHARVVPSTMPTQGNGLYSEVEQSTTTEAVKKYDYFADAAGNMIAAPAFLKPRQIDAELLVTRQTWEQEQPAASATLPVIGTAYGTGFIYAADGLDSIIVVKPGTGYTFTSPSTVTVIGGSVAATATITALKAVSVDAVVNPSSGLVSGQTYTAAGGTGTAATVKGLTFALQGGGPISGGIDYAPGDVVTCAGGTPVAGKTVVTKIYGLAKGSIYNGGQAYAIGDTITFAEGTFTDAAIITVTGIHLQTGSVTAFTITSAGHYTTKPATLTQASTSGPGQHFWLSNAVFALLETVDYSNDNKARFIIATVRVNNVTVVAPGIDYAIGNTITLTGGTFSVAAIVTVSHGQLAAATRNAAGSGYLPGETIVLTVTGGVVVTKPVLTLLTVAAASVQTFAQLGTGTPGTGYLIGDTVDAAGGTFTTATRFTVTMLGIKTWNINNAGAGYIVGDLVNITDDLPNTVQFHVLTVSGGGGITSLGPPDNMGFFNGATTAYNLGGGSGAAATINMVTFDGVSRASIAIAGSYSVAPATFTQGSTSGAGTGVTVHPIFGVLTFSISTPGDLTTLGTAATQFSTSGSGAGATFNALRWGVKTATMSNSGNFTAFPNPRVLTQGSTSGAGTGATFQPHGYALTATLSAPGEYQGTLPLTLTQDSTNGSGTGIIFGAPSFGALTLSIVNPGSYTALPANPVTFTGGTQTGTLTANLSWGVGAITVVTPGGGYQAALARIVISGGSGTGAGAAGFTAGFGWAERPAYVIGGSVEDATDKPTKKVTILTMPVPPTRLVFPKTGYEFPALFTPISDASFFSFPMHGLDYSVVPHRRGQFTAWEYLDYSLGPFQSTDPVFTVTTPGEGSQFFPIKANTIHPAFSWKQFYTNREVAFTDPAALAALTAELAAVAGAALRKWEIFGASTSYVQGQWIVVGSNQEPLRDAGIFFERKTRWLNELNT